jgi:Cu/Ag efflux protein CusF
VQEQIHIGMGLAGMLIIEPNRPNNHFAHLIPGAGRITSMAKATREQYQNEYSLIYMDIDDRLHRIPAAYRDPREIEMRMHRDYDVTQRKSNIFLLNGRSFPFTLRDSPIVVNSNETTKLRILNVGPRTVYLHTHGHHPTLTDLDGYPVPKEMRITRDTFDIGPAQRVDLALQTGNDGVHAVGPGVWLMHDHAQPAATNKGINPGGDHTAIVYSEFMGEDGLPRDALGHDSHAKFFDPAYYQGKVPVFDPRIFGTDGEHYAHGWPADPPAGGAFDYPAREPESATLPRLDLIDAERHRTVATSCQDRPRGFRRIRVKAGRQYGRAGEVFAFEPRELHAERCEEVEIVLENNDEIRHDFMIPGLDPIFAINFVGPDTESARFVTPDEDVTLFFHCHVPTHEKVGMTGVLVVGKGGAPKQLAQVSAPAAKTVSGIGVVIAAVPRAGRLIVNHEEIKNFMGAMEMAYPVTPPALLNGLNPGDKINFRVDTASSTITAIEVIERAQ